MTPARCIICCLPEDDHGPDGLVYKALYGWHTFTNGSGALTGAPPPRSTRRPARVRLVEPTISMTRRPSTPGTLARALGDETSHQLNRSMPPPLPHRAPGASRNPKPALAPRPLPWWGRWRRFHGGNR
ncbi:hypothetical protein AB0I72_19815 [Nocardiopsis sp. NPDC049922]|uniref:hypothetical protein n=1 Tax=Nocardiopsis sp. NPDC049922 TaxID=3155157 RepID=UPI00340B7110